MLPTIIIGALALAILWPFIRLGYELIKLAGSLVLLVASCAIGAVALIGPGAFHLISACRRHAGTKKDDTVPPTAANSDRAPHAPGIFLGALGPHRREPAKRKTEQAYISKGPCHEEQPD